jgi:hypothetical protein
MSKNTNSLIFDFLRARVVQERRRWQKTNIKPNSAFFQLKARLIQDFQSRRVHFQVDSKSILILKKKINNTLPTEPEPSLINVLEQTLKIPKSEITQLLKQFGNFIATDHRRRYGPLSLPKVKFLKKATLRLEEGMQKGLYPHQNLTFVIGPMIRKCIKLKNILTQFPEVSNIEFRSLDPLDLGCYFELPYDDYRLQRVQKIKPLASLVIDYSWCEIPQNYQSTPPVKP